MFTSHINLEGKHIGQEWWRCLAFVGCYSLLDYGYFRIPIETFINVIYYHGVVTVCADCINMLFPLEQVLARQNHLISVKADLEIVRGCDGAGVVFLIIAAILTFPAKMGRKLLGLILGVSLIYGLNLLRIGFLYFTIAYRPDLFSLIHTYLAPTLMVITGCAYFVWWAFGAVNQIHAQA